MRLRTVVTTATVACLFGCGSGGGGSQQTSIAPMRVVIQWAARSRDLSAPSSALSAVITLAHASPNGSDASFIANRRQDPAAYAEVAASPSPVRVGNSLLSVRFYAHNNGAGDLVGAADAQVLLQSDGSLAKPDGAPLGDILTDRAVVYVEVPLYQNVIVGQDQALLFTARDAGSNVVAVTPGSVFFTVTAGGEFLSVDAPGNAHGIAPGTATVVATVDGRESQPIPVLVTTPIQLRRINLRTNDIAFDPKTGKLFASVPSADTTGHGNRIVFIDPTTAGITGSVFVGSEPNRIAISDDGHYLYVGIDGAASVRRVDLQTMTADLQFSLGSDPFFGRRICADLAVMPGSPHTVVASMKYAGPGLSFAGLGMYVDGVLKSNLATSPAWPSAGSITFGATPYRLYGIDTLGQGYGFSRFAVNEYGFTGSDYSRNLVLSGGQIKFYGNWVYSSGGQVVEGESYTILGRYDLGLFIFGGGPTNGFAVDAAVNRAYFLVTGPSNAYLTLFEFDRSQFQKISTHVVPISSDYTERNVVPRMVLCGGGALAYNTRGGQHPELGQVVIVYPGG